ncbi:hypothetical protein [Poseidonocella sp. HB161398]|uniref:hypothetical protein n=1 Tax=Poseidonocella sp. HB161398 TaxID=2320855 RepID=UPI001107A9D8|nr:hypothetical protein [Poseidonocella sp. HB161398]
MAPLLAVPAHRDERGEAEFLKFFQRIVGILACPGQDNLGRANVGSGKSFAMTEAKTAANPLKPAASRRTGLGAGMAQPDSRSFRSAWALPVPRPACAVICAERSCNGIPLSGGAAGVLRLACPLFDAAATPP